MTEDRQPVPCHVCNDLHTEGTWLRAEDGALLLFCPGCWSSKIDALPFKRGLQRSVRRLEDKRLKIRKQADRGVPGGWNRKRRRADPAGYAKALRELGLHPDQLERDGL